MRLHELINENVDKEKILKLLHDNFNIADTLVGPGPKIDVDDNGIIDISSPNKFAHIETILVGEPTGRLPVNFGNVRGIFRCSGAQLTTLEGSPQVVSGNFQCFSNRLTSLIGGPKKVEGEYNCYLNPLQSLDGLPEEVSRFRLGYQPTLPLLRILNIKNLKSIRILSTLPQTEMVEKIMNRYIGKGKAGMLQCAAELSKIGCKENAQL